MKSILMNIQYFLMFLAILSCSKDSEQSQVKFSSFTMALEGTIIQGGVAIYGENKESFENFSTIIFPNEGEKFIEITPRVWKFHAFAYTGESGPLTGSLYCDAIDVGLSPGEQEVNLVLSQNNCLEMQSKSAGDPEAAVFAQVVIHSCQSLINEPSDPSNTCNGIYGPQKSFKLMWA